MAAAISQASLLEEHWLPEFGDKSLDVHDPGIAGALEQFDWAAFDKTLSSGGDRGSVNWNGSLFNKLWSPFATNAGGVSNSDGSPNLPEFMLSLMNPVGGERGSGGAGGDGPDSSPAYDKMGTEFFAGAMNRHDDLKSADSSQGHDSKLH